MHVFISVGFYKRNAKSMLGAAQKMKRDAVWALGAYNQSEADKTIQTWNTSAEKAVKIYEVQGRVGFSRERQDWWGGEQITENHCGWVCFRKKDESKIEASWAWGEKGWLSLSGVGWEQEKQGPQVRKAKRPLEHQVSMEDSVSPWRNKPSWLRLIKHSLLYQELAPPLRIHGVCPQPGRVLRERETAPGSPSSRSAQTLLSEAGPRVCPEDLGPQQLEEDVSLLPRS